MERIDFDQLEYDSLQRLCHEGRPFTGIAFELWPDGSLRSEVVYLDGAKHGWSRAWYEDGELESEAHFRRGGANGARRRWYPGGQLAVDAETEFGICIRRKEWAADGVLTQSFEIGPNDALYDLLQLRRARSTT